jgi:hypothetical protein
MAIEQLQIKIGADVKGVVSNVEAANKSVGKLAFSLDALQQKLKAKQNLLITERDLTKIQAYRVEVAALEKQVAAVSKITLGQTSAGIEGLASGANKAFSAVRKLAYILPGIGIAGIVGFGAEFIADLVKGGDAVEKFRTALGYAGRTAIDTKKLFSDVFKEAAKSAGDDVAKLDVFRNKLNDLNLSSTERIKVAKEYNKIADDTNKIDLTQINNLDLINRKIAAQNALILQRAVSTAALSKLTEASSKFVDAQLELTEALKTSGKTEQDVSKIIEQNSKAQIDARNDQIKSLDNYSGAQSRYVANQRNNANKQSTVISQEIVNLGKLLGTRDEAKRQLDELNKALSPLITVPGITTKDGQKIEKPKTDDTLKKELEEKKKILLEFVKDFETIKIPFPKLSKPFEDFNAGELRDELRDKLNKALTGIAPIKIKIPVDPVIGIDIKKIPIPLKPTIEWKDTDLHGQLEDFARVGNQIGESLGHGFGDVFQKIFEQSLTDAVLKGMDGKALENFKGGLAAVAVVTADAFNGLGDAFGNLTSSLLKGENGIKAFGDSLKNTFSQLAAQLIKTIALAAILSLVTGGASGGGLSFLGSFKKILGFAKGGPVPGVGSGDTVPAMLTPGEFVVTKDKAPFVASLLKSMGSLKMPKLINGSYHFAQGGFVPSTIDRTKPTSQLRNITATSLVNVHVTGQSVTRGKDLVYVWTQELKSQGRAT